MDVEQLHQVLQQSFAPDAAVRKPAEDTIRNLKHLPGAVQLLLQVAAEKQVRFEVRQAAAIQLKNICREGWAERVHFAPYSSTSTSGEGSAENSSTAVAAVGAAVSPAGSGAAGGSHTVKPPLLSDHDKEAVKQNGLLKALLDEPEKSIRDLLAETLHVIVIHDFPEKWPELIPTLLSTIQNGISGMGGSIGDPHLRIPSGSHGLHVHNALLALRKVCKRYEYKSKEQRGPLNEIVNAAFPLLLPLGQELSLDNQYSIEAAMMLKQILKIFWSSTQFYLPGSDVTDPSGQTTSSIGLARPEKLQPWFDILTRSLQKPLPDDRQPSDLDARNSWPWWKVKKWSVQIMSRLFSRYGIPSYADDQDAKDFALYFSQTVAPQFLGPVCETLNLRPTGHFCTDRVVHLCLTYVDLAVELASTYRLLKPHLDFLLYQVCFPTMCLHEEDIDCFENDPVEFVHKQNSPLADFYDPRMSAITLVTDLVKHRGQDVTQNLLGRMTEVIQRYMTASLEQKNHIEKDGALLTFGSLAKYLLANDKYAGEVEGLLVSSVFPDFNSPVAFLRYRACWMVQQFSGVQFSDDGTHMRHLLEMVLNRLSDPALPVQIEASKALRFLIQADGVESTLLPVLPQMLNEYFRIMNEIGNDEVVSALQALLDRFGEHIEPHAQALITQLTNAFQQYSSAGEDDDDDDAALAAAQCLECISTVLKGVCGNASILKSLEPLLLPLVLKILGNDGDFIEYLECGLDILTFLTFFQDGISPELWQAFPLIYIAFDQWAYDYLNMMVPCLQSFISKNPDVFINSRASLPEGQIPYVDLVCSMVAKTLTNDRASENECRHALSLFMCILHNCFGRVDPYLSFLNDIVLGKLGQQVNADSPLTRISVYQVLGSALHYNAQLELVELEKRGVTQQVFSKWMSDAESMDRWLPRKLTVLGWSSILTVPVASLPPTIATSLPNLIHAVVQMSLALKADADKGTTTSSGVPEGIEEGDEEEDEDDHKDGDEAVDLDRGFGEDEDVKNEVDEAYRKALSGVSNWEDDMAKFLLGDWEEDGEDVDEDYVSPLDQVDELLVLSETLQLAFQREPEVYQQIQAALPPDSVAACQRLFATAETLRAEEASRQQQQQQLQQQPL